MCIYRVARKEPNVSLPAAQKFALVSAISMANLANSISDESQDEYIGWNVAEEMKAAVAEGIFIFDD